VKESIARLGIESKVQAVRANAGGWSDHNMEKSFDIVILAPPYDDLQPNLIQKLTKHLKKDGILVLDYPGKESPPELKWVKQILKKDYGDAQLVFYRKIS
jgi:16S rRNA G966 N2-methylase RsmD